MKAMALLALLLAGCTLVNVAVLDNAKVEPDGITISVKE